MMSSNIDASVFPGQSVLLFLLIYTNLSSKSRAVLWSNGHYVVIMDVV